MSTPNLRDLVYNQPYLEVNPEESSQLPSETVLRAISSSSLFPVHYANHDNPPKKERKFALSLREWNSPNTQRKGSGGIKPIEPISWLDCSAKIESQPLSEDDSVEVILSPDLNGKVFVPRRIELNEGSEVQVGRGNGAKAKASAMNAIFDCKVLSRIHATLTYRQRHFYLKDRKSSNGTFVNKTRISADEEFEIYSGDIIQFGQDVSDPSTNDKHRCIITKVELIDSSGKSFPARPCSLLGTPTIIDSECTDQELSKLRDTLEEAIAQEDLIGEKMEKAQKLLESIKDAVSQSWQSMISEDELLTKVERIEAQLIDKLGQNKVEELEARSKYESEMKKMLKNSSDQKLEADVALIQAEKIVGSKSQENKLLTQQIEKLKQETEKLKTKMKKENQTHKRGDETDGDKQKNYNESKATEDEEERENREERRMNKLNIEMRFLRNEVIEEEEEETYKTVTSRDEIVENEATEADENRNKEKGDWQEGLVPDMPLTLENTSSCLTRKLSNVTLTSKNVSLNDETSDKTCQTSFSTFDSKACQTGFSRDEDLTKSLVSLAKVAERINAKFEQMEEFLQKVPEHDQTLKETQMKISALERSTTALFRIQGSAHQAIFYISTFVILFLFLFLFKFGVKENRRLEVW